LGLELTKSNYFGILSLYYGIGFGSSSGTFEKWDSKLNRELLVEKTINSIHIDILLGLNLNIFKFLHTQVMYKFEPVGSYYLLKDNSGFTNSIQHSVSFSARCFLF
jgi:hypothetical protein